MDRELLFKQETEGNDWSKEVWLVLHLSCMVSQGSILGPLLFLIYVTGIIDNMDSEIRLVTDATFLFEPVMASINNLNSDLNKLSILAKQWLVNFSPTKTRFIFFSNLIEPFIIYFSSIENF